MSKINDGGPAFPISKDVVYQQLNGMSLRDWFAGQALMGIGAWCPRNVEPNSDEWHAARAGHAYADADAMLAARSKGDA